LQIFDLLRVERPLISLEEDSGRHRFHGREEIDEKIVRLLALGVCAEEARDGLHVRSRDVPAELDAGQSEL